MDEILIDEKRYVSSKQAAKLTGYAKDYIGQLCREGRVPARLVGRSWYVLETAIQDHRFGVTDIQNKEIERAAISAPVVFSQALETPRYEASPAEELLPSIKRKEEEIEDPAAESTEEPIAPEPLQDSWRAWFDHVADMGEIEATPANEPEMQEIVDGDEETGEEAEAVDVNVPIHAIYQEYQEPPRELLPHSVREEQTEGQELPVIRQEKLNNSGSRVMIRAIQVCSVLIALVAVSLAVIGSGYLDKYIISSSQARIFAGVELYNK